MNRIHLILTLALLTAVMVSPFEARAVSEMAGFDHPDSLPDQASDRAREALDARGIHGGGQDGGDGDGADDNAADVENSHEVEAGESVTIEHHVTNDVVNLNITITITPGEGVERSMDLDVKPPGTDRELPVGPPVVVPVGPPEDAVRDDGRNN